MKKRFFLLLASLAVTVVGFKATQTQVLCKGIVEENDRNIPISVMSQNGMTQQEFNRVLDVVEKNYGPVIRSLGGTLKINRNWSDGTVNASAMREGTTYVLNMYGGLARHPAINPDGFMLVACHELGHHLGGAPKISGWWSDWASNEGQADYFANLKCLRHVFTAQDNADFVAKGNVDATVRTECETQFNTQEDENLCMRASMAGQSVGFLFQDLRKEANPPNFATPDSNVVAETDDEHPGTQCRLDTYFNGSICTKSASDGLSDSDPSVGTCTHSQGFTKGLRPQCWFKPID